MIGLSTPYVHLQNVLTKEDIDFLMGSCKSKLATDGMPCYTLIDSLTAPPYLKIKGLLEERIGGPLYYLNDFYIYTDSSSTANWHMDTELFTFESAVNAWILLSPDHVDDPLGFIDDINDSTERFYHSVAIRDGECTFGECLTGKYELRSLEEVEAHKIHTPRISLGDVLVINPKRFHKTNVSTPKHGFAIKFLLRGSNGFRSGIQVPEEFWPEVATFNKLISRCDRWDDVVEGIRQTLKTSDGRKELSAGFFPEKFDLYKRMVSTL